MTKQARNIPEVLNVFKGLGLRPVYNTKFKYLFLLITLGCRIGPVSKRYVL